MNVGALVTEGQVIGLVNRLDREGLFLTPRAMARIHDIITECLPDRRTEGNQTELAAYVRERIQRDNGHDQD